MSHDIERVGNWKYATNIKHVVLINKSLFREYQLKTLWWDFKLIHAI
jgi:hypothetical protein